MHQLSKEREALSQLMRDMKEREEAQRRQILQEKEEIDRQKKEIEQARITNPPPPMLVAQGSMRVSKNTTNKVNAFAKVVRDV